MSSGTDAAEPGIATEEPSEPPGQPETPRGHGRWAFVRGELRAGWRRVKGSVGFWATVAAFAVYVAAMLPLALAKYATFNQTFADLGIENQVLWLLSHGGITAYYASGFAQVYPLQYQKPILFLTLPLYAVYPHPEMLLVLGTLALAGAAIPLFLFARRMLHNEWYSLVLAVAYLVYFPVASANLFDFHYEDFAPLGFFLLCWCWAAGRPRLMYVAAALTAAVNPLMLVIVIFFLLFTTLPPPRVRLGLAWLSASLGALRRDRMRVFAIVVLGAVLLVYAAVGVLFTAGLGSGGAPLSPTAVLFQAVNAKLFLLVLMVGALAFLPFFSLRGFLVAVPYFAYAFYSVNSANYAAFGLMYPLFGTGPLFLAAIDGIAAASGRVEGTSDSVGRPAPPTDPVPPRVTARPSALFSERGAMIRALAVAAALFALVFFPYSPANPYVAGGYFSGNHDLAGITQSSSQTVFLQKVVDLVPPEAQVLTQNNIPQLSGRYHVQIAPLYTPGIPYDSIVMDSALTYFSPPGQILPYVDAAFQSGSYGVVAEGEGALLLEQNYSAAPLVFVPTQVNLTGADMTPYSAQVNGTTLVGGSPSFSMWYGPYAFLYPGNYRCLFELSSNTTKHSATPALTLDVTIGLGSQELVQRGIFPQDFAHPGQPATFELDFHLNLPAPDVEFRGMGPTGVSMLTLYGIDAEQLTPGP